MVTDESMYSPQGAGRPEYRFQRPLDLASRIEGGAEPLDSEFARSTESEANSTGSRRSNPVEDRTPISADSFEAASRAGGTEEPPGRSAQDGSV